MSTETKTLKGLVTISLRNDDVFCISIYDPLSCCSLVEVG